MADELTPLRAVAFEVSAYPKQPAFAVDKEVCRTLGIEGSGDGERLHLLIGNVDTGETLYSGVKEMRSGQQIYEKKDEREIGHAIRSG